MSFLGQVCRPSSGCRWLMLLPWLDPSTSHPSSLRSGSYPLFFDHPSRKSLTLGSLAISSSGWSLYAACSHSLQVVSFCVFKHCGYFSWSLRSLDFIRIRFACVHSPGFSESLVSCLSMSLWIVTGVLGVRTGRGFMCDLVFFCVIRVSHVSLLLSTQTGSTVFLSSWARACRTSCRSCSFPSRIVWESLCSCSIRSLAGVVPLASKLPLDCPLLSARGAHGAIFVQEFWECAVLHRCMSFPLCWKRWNRQSRWILTLVTDTTNVRQTGGLLLMAAVKYTTERTNCTSFGNCSWTFFTQVSILEPFAATDFAQFWNFVQFRNLRWWRKPISKLTVWQIVQNVFLRRMPLDGSVWSRCAVLFGRFVRISSSLISCTSGAQWSGTTRTPRARRTHGEPGSDVGFQDYREGGETLQVGQQDDDTQFSLHLQDGKALDADARWRHCRDSARAWRLLVA